ncbi:MAG: tRNA (adenosine(37)-N6)-dimethylallyltransferase MiaA [Fimbriimonadales bacterium]|nr:tRNA (adenosine(37)-N6)-dimethylallyltransferase MiaA [Fimbriimonadales bacterium]
MRPALVAVMGPTASGKTALADALADRWGARLVNADAFQCYRGLDIGTAKPTRRERYELLDIKDPTEQLTVGEWVERARRILEEAFLEGRSVVVAGGTGLYIRALFEEYADMAEPPNPQERAEIRAWADAVGAQRVFERLRELDPQAADRVDPRNPVRVVRALERALHPPKRQRRPLPPFRKAKLALIPSPDETRLRVRARLERMLAEGWLDEVRRLRERGVPRNAPGLRAIGYRELWDVLEGRCAILDAEVRILRATVQYAKRQRTWLRSEPGLRPLRWNAAMEEQIGEAEANLTLI